MISGPPVHPPVENLNEDDLEVIYWEVRGHDGCYRTVAALQHFFDLFPTNHPLRIRTADGEDFITDIDSRVILEFDLHRPLQIMHIAMGGGKSFSTGDQERMNQAVWGFERPGEEMVGIALDMASMQFGEKGRGKGGENFMLGTLDAFYNFVETVVAGGDPMKLGSKRIGPSPHDKWLKEVARRVRYRWTNRETGRWCDHCGKPLDAPKSCPCHEVFYCGSAHQKKAWRFHKKHCSKRKTN
ncbi:hypothetical protein BDZ94DRAFT_1197616 [Collybia nuda]|uniref:MYND-type domain-containing protein n=1 Tax=Collybia nuda TaxID=64659 RepID=A0A9P5XZI0_9AGAR|nr:hypothetical protein BDZ94DRAFT_1197616 [Collybia nuda]